MKFKSQYTLFSLVSVLLFYSYLTNGYAVGRTGWVGLNKIQPPKPKPLAGINGMSDDVAGILYNPAISGTLRRSELSVLAELGYTDDKVAGIIYNRPLKTGTISVGIANFDTGKMVLTYIENGIETEKIVTGQTDIIGLVSYSNLFTKKLYTGISFKLVSSRIAETVPGYAYVTDFGVSYTFIPELTVSLVGQNFGFSTKLGDRQEKIPSSVWFGAGYRKSSKHTNLIFAGEVTYTLDEQRVTPSLVVQFGKVPVNIFCGYRFNVPETPLSLGLTITGKMYSLSYVYLPAQWLNPVHRISVNFKFGAH